jgi:regulator of replication initiation timing
MKAAELTVKVNDLTSENTALRADVNRLMATVAALVEHDKAIRAEVRELRARRQPDTLERRSAGNEPFAAARAALIAERGLARNAWVPYTEIRARMEADRAQPPSPTDETVAL